MNEHAGGKVQFYPAGGRACSAGPQAAAVAPGAAAARNADRDRSEPPVAAAEREPALPAGRRRRCAGRERRPLLRRRLGEHAGRLRHLARHDGAGRPHRRRRRDVSRRPAQHRRLAHRARRHQEAASTSTWTRSARARHRTSRSRPATSSRCRPRRRRWCPTPGTGSSPTWSASARACRSRGSDMRRLDVVPPALPPAPS